MNITVLSQVQQQEPLHHLQEVQQPVIMLCQPPAKELSSSRAHTLWGNPRNHQRDLRGILQGTLIMITLTPVKTLGMMFHMVVAAFGPGAKLSVMEQVGALLKRCIMIKWLDITSSISHFTAQVLSHFKLIACLHSQGSVCSLHPLNHRGSWTHQKMQYHIPQNQNCQLHHWKFSKLIYSELVIDISFTYRVIHELLTTVGDYLVGLYDQKSFINVGSSLSGCSGMGVV